MDEKKVALDVMTFFKVIPWVLMKPEVDVNVWSERATKESSALLARGTDIESRKAHLRAMIHNWSGILPMRIPPEAYEPIIESVIKSSDDLINEKYDDGLGDPES